MGDERTVAELMGSGWNRLVLK